MYVHVPERGVRRQGKEEGLELWRWDSGQKIAHLRDQQILQLKTRNVELCFGTTVGSS